MSKAARKPVAITAIPAGKWEKAKKSLPKAHKAWAELQDFTAKPGSVLQLPDGKGGLAGVLYGLSDDKEIWRWAGLPSGLPAGKYQLDGDWSPEDKADAALAWELANYSFDTFKSDTTVKKKAVLEAGRGKARKEAAVIGSAITFVRDLINTPAENMSTYDLSDVMEQLAGRHGAEFDAIRGFDLMEARLMGIYTVGRAAPENPPQLLDMTWGDESHPKVTLVGKGVCFDTGGLDLKPPAAMRLMKKDMGGAANVLGLAHMIMAAKLPIRLRVLIPAVENNVSSNSFRPGDVIKTYKGITVEVGNTDAEGRLILCDALALADEDEPDLLIDCATLTGAARVALGPELPAIFTENLALAEKLMETGQHIGDPVWHLPLWKPYLSRMDSPVADTNNISEGPFAGAITAALFLQRFVTKSKSWLHVDLFGWNDRARPGRPAGGEAQAIRTIYAMLKSHYG